jgi:hypothetical protein
MGHWSTVSYHDGPSDGQYCPCFGCVPGDGHNFNDALRESDLWSQKLQEVGLLTLRAPLSQTSLIVFIEGAKNNDFYIRVLRFSRGCTIHCVM